MIRSLAVLPVLLVLAACGDEPAEAPTDDRRGAEGEVLGGTIHDAMLPLPTVRSQSPPLESSTGTTAAAGGPTPSAGQTEPSAQPGDEPADEPEPAPETTED